MNQDIRNKLRNVVTHCRKLLEDSVSQELEGKYGIFAKKDQVTADPNAKMPHLTEEEQVARKDILDHFGHVKARGFKPKEALDQLVREIAFTHLNRLCAYKMMEARQVYVGGHKFREAVSRGIKSNGFLHYLGMDGHEADERLYSTGQQHIAYRHFLDWLGGLLSGEIGVLFNPNDPANRLYPRQKTLDEVLDLLNGGGIKPEETELREEWPKIWSQDETIGWVYQYFTPKELRDAARDPKKGGSQAPRNSYELSFRNQFFTPRYVVEFLTDNTLGRIWYEMRKGDTNIKDKCRYLVRRPTEIFLKEGEQPPKHATPSPDDLSEEELLKLPLHIPHRPKKDPRDLKILDPASGSGHFLLYCFDLLLTIYEEAYTDPQLGPALQKNYPKLEDLRRELPRLILAHNLHGIDIDLRASQIAALALWLRCQRAYQDIGLKKERPEIKRSNLVCAEPMPGEEQMLKEFVGTLEPKVLSQVVEVVFDKMHLAGEAGSLLKIEEEIKDAVAQARKQWLAGPISIQQTLFDNDKPTVQQQRFDFSGITNAQFFEQAEGKVVDALHTYAKKSHNGQRLPWRLFSDDAERGFAFVDLCHKRFDVVLMNPPFGRIIARTDYKNLLERSYPDSWTDYFLLFLDRGRQLSAALGMLGAVIPNRLLNAKKAGTIRDTLSTSWTASCIVDCGRDVMDDAAVDALLLVAPGPPHDGSPSCFFLNIHSVPPSDRADHLAQWVMQPHGERVLSLFRCIPGIPFAYDKPRELLRLWQHSHRLEPDYATVATGGKTFDDDRFLRLRWEVHPQDLKERWVSVDTGGDYQPWVSPPVFTEDWQCDGKMVRENAIARHGSDAQVIQSRKFWFKPGLAYPYTSSIGFGTRIFPEGTILSTDAIAVSPKEGTDPLFLLGVLASSWSGELLTVFGNHRKTENSSVKSLPLHLDEGQLNKVRRLAESAVNRVQRLDSFRESSPYFLRPPKRNEIGFLAEELTKIQLELDDVCRQVFLIPGDYHLSVDHSELVSAYAKEPTKAQHAQFMLSYFVGAAIGRWDVRLVAESEFDNPLPDPFGRLPLVPPGMLKGTDEPASDIQLDGYPIQIDWDSILVDDRDHKDDIVERVQQVLQAVWKERADAVEKEICEALGVGELREYFRKPGKGGFWDDHISGYSKSHRRAPIYWLLQSAKKNYALWLYYHRLDKDLLFKALVNYVEPKIRLETSRLETFRSQKAAAGDSVKDAKRLAKEVERQEDFISELRDFEDKLRRAANLHLEPDRNDGVVLNIASLHELVPWKQAKNYWEELLAGKYEWSSIGKQLRQKGLVK